MYSTIRDQVTMKSLIYRKSSNERPGRLFQIQEKAGGGAYSRGAITFACKQQHNLSINIQSCLYSSNSGTLGIRNYFRFAKLKRVLMCKICSYSQSRADYQGDRGERVHIGRGRLVTLISGKVVIRVFVTVFYWQLQVNSIVFLCIEADVFIKRNF